MRIPIPLSRLPTHQRISIGLRLVLLLLLAVAGALLVTDRPGLRAEYFALGTPWEGRPLYSTVGEPRLETASQIRQVLMTEVGFSVRWSGWWAVAREGEHRFSLDADDGGYLRIDDELIVDSRGVFGERRKAGRKALEAGFHAVEIGLYQTLGESRLAVHWVAPGSMDESAAPLPLDDLYARRPLALRETLRSALSFWPRTYRQLLGAALLLAAVLMLRGFAMLLEAPTAWLRALNGRGLHAALLLGLFALAFFASFPFTGTVRGGDDTAYLNAANFGDKAWFFNRYAHIYLLKFFITVSGGDPLVGVRVWWSFIFATTVAAIAVAVRSIGPGLQLRTLAATLFLLLAQTTLFGLIGAAFADYSAMMFVTVAVATYLHGLAFTRDRPPLRHEWHALAIGALTVAAFRSKEVGAVLLFLPILFLIGNPRLDLRRLARRMVYWTVGAGGVLLALALLDGWILGDFLFTFDSGRLAQSGSMNFPEQLAPRKATASWLEAIWRPWSHAVDLSLRHLWVGVVAAALAAGLRRRRLELRLLHLMPIAYLVALIALYVGMPHPFSGRMLIPILPVACLMTGLLLHYAGLDEVPRRQLLMPGVLIPTALVAAIVFIVAIPYRLGTLEAAGFLPVALLRRYGWEPDHFVVGVLLPAIVLIVVSWVALVVSRRRARVAALLIAFTVFFGTGFEISRASLAKHWAVQKGELLLYPWKTFHDELNAVPARKIVLSRELQWRYHMSATTRSALARLSLRRPDLDITLARDLPADAEVAIASRYVYRQWRRRLPALAATASFDPAGLLVLVRPKEATEKAAELIHEHRGKTVEERLAELRSDRDPKARERLLQEILDNNSSSLRPLWSDQISAVALSLDGWTHGTRPAAILVENLKEEPSVHRIKLAVNAKVADYPIRVFLDDGEEVQTVVFARSGRRDIELPPVPPLSTRLFIIWCDKAWSPEGKDARQLGVRIIAPD